MSSNQNDIAYIFIDHTFRVALKSYELDCGDYPTTEEGIQALLSPPNGKENEWNGPYLESEFKVDPWGRVYQYRYPAENKGVEYDLFSMGADGVISEDDIANWKEHTMQSYQVSHIGSTDILLISTGLIWVVAIAYILKKRHNQ